MKSQEPVIARYSLPGNGVNVAPTLLIVGPVEDDCGRDPVFDQFPWPAHRVRNCLELALHLHGSPACVVVCERRNQTEQEAVGPLPARPLRYANVLTASFVVSWALYAGIRFLE